MNSSLISKNLLNTVRCMTVQRFYTVNHKLVPSQENNAVENKRKYIPKENLSKEKYYKNFKKKTSNLKSESSNPEIARFLTSSRNDPDSFGTLSEDWGLEKKLSEMPEEEGDAVETEYLFNKEGKRRLTINQYAKIMKKFIKQKKIGHAVEVLETRMLKEDRAQPDNYIYNLLITACGQVGYMKKAFNLYKRMRDRGLKVTGHTYTGLFNACANSPYPGTALSKATHLRLSMQESAVLVNQKLYHAMIKAFGRLGDLETAFMLVDEMLEKKVVVTGETFNFLLQACITDKEAGFRHALMVWRKMKQRAIRPNLFTFNLLMRCSRDCGLGDRETTQQVIQVLLHNTNQQRSSPDSPLSLSGAEESRLTVRDGDETLPNLISREPTMGNIVAVAALTLPEHRLMLMGGAKGVLEQMAIFSVTPDIKTFTQLLDQIPSTVDAEEELLRAMEQHKVTLDIDFCNMLIRKRSLRRDCDGAKAVLKIIRSRDLRPDLVTFGVLAMACPTLDSAQQLLENMHNVGHRPNVQIMGALLKNGCYAQDCDYVVEMMKKFKEEGLKANEMILETLDKFHGHLCTVVKNPESEAASVVSRQSVDRYRRYYRKWRPRVEPVQPPHPWQQFTQPYYDPEDLELMNKGRAKLAK